MTETKKIAIMIHDLNPWGGQDRSMLEIAWQLNKGYPLEIHSYSLQGFSNWPNMEHIKYEALIKKPILFKYLNYHFKSWRNLKQDRDTVVQSTGTASLKSDTVQIQFIHHTWQEIARQLPADKIHTAGFFKEIYRSLLDIYKRKLEKRIYNPDKHYIAISHSIKKELMEYFAIPSENITIIHHGVDNQYFTPVESTEQGRSTRQEIRQNLGIQPDDVVLLHVGALNARKGLFQTIEILSFLKKNGFHKVKYLAVGQGETKLLKQLIKEHDVEDRVILVSHSKDIRNYYWASDIFFFPTYYEPFGLVILEAMACGLAVATSSIAGGSELIEDGSNGILFDPHEKVGKIADKLLPILRNAELRATIGKKARTVAEQRSWTQVGEEYLDFYRKLPRK